jgi:prevent-host-death family protein
MRRVNVSQLKAHLGEMLADVRGGAAVIVCERNMPIARLVPFAESSAEDFHVAEPSRPPAALKSIRGVRPRARVDVVKLLRESRDQR